MERTLQWGTISFGCSDPLTVKAVLRRWSWISLSRSLSLWSDWALKCWYAGNGSGSEWRRGRKEDVEWWGPLYLHKPFEVDEFTPPPSLSRWPLPPHPLLVQGQAQERDTLPNTMGQLILAQYWAVWLTLPTQESFSVMVIRVQHHWEYMIWIFWLNELPWSPLFQLFLIQMY